MEQGGQMHDKNLTHSGKHHTNSNTNADQNTFPIPGPFRASDLARLYHALQTHRGLERQARPLQPLSYKYAHINKDSPEPSRPPCGTPIYPCDNGPLELDERARVPPWGP